MLEQEQKEKLRQGLLWLALSAKQRKQDRALDGLAAGLQILAKSHGLPTFLVGAFETAVRNLPIDEKERILLALYRPLRAYFEGAS